VKHVSQGVFRAANADLRSALAALGLPAGVDVHHQFAPVGQSWVRCAHDRQIALHTWPEHELVTVDVLASAPVDLVAALRALGWTPIEANP